MAADGFVELSQHKGDFRQVAGALRRHDGPAARGRGHLNVRQPSLAKPQSPVPQARHQRLVQRGHAIVIEARGHGAEHRHAVQRLGEAFMVALILFAYVAQRILGALAVELVDGHEVRKIEHVDFFQLAGCAEFRSHDVHGNVDQRDDGRFPLADAGGFHDDQVKAADFAAGQDVRQRGGYFRARVAGGQGAHEHRVRVDRIHPNPITEQRAAGAFARRIDGNDGNPGPVALVEPQSQNEFVRER